MKQLKCAVIGGGTGSFTLLSALRDNISDISALVTMADDGGSSGTLRDELGVLPPGDIRQCLIALSHAPKELRDLFNFRFATGSLRGHSFGNLFLSAVEKMTDDFGDAVRVAGEVLSIKGRVVPITFDDVRLVASWSDGTSLKGERHIDVNQFIEEKGRPELSLEPAAHINPQAKQVLEEADLIVFAPGDLYTSLGPLLMVQGVSEVLQYSKAKKIYVCNLVVKPGQTDGFTVIDHAAEIERFARSQLLDYVIYNTARPDETLFKKYRREGELLVEPGDNLEKRSYQLLGRDLIAKEHGEIKNDDALAAHRSYIRHDRQALWQAIQEIL